MIRIEYDGFFLEFDTDKFISVFGGVTIFEVDGYYVFIAEKRDLSRTKKTKEQTDFILRKDI